MSSSEKPARIVRTPRPPYYVVTTTTELLPGYDQQMHFDIGVQLYDQAQNLGGFLGLDLFFSGGASIAASYWEDIDAVRRWRDHKTHQEAKTLAKSGWFGATITRIAKVEKDYGFNLEGCAPVSPDRKAE